MLAALALLSLAALMIAGAFASLTLSRRNARDARADALLVAAADYAVNTILSSPNDYALADLAYGKPATFAVGVPGPDPIAVTVAATRLRGGVIWFVADASVVRGDSARRRLNVVARFATAGTLPGAPLVARGNVRIARGVSFAADQTIDPDCARAAPNVVVVPGATVSSADSIAWLADSAAADSSAFYLTAAQLATLDSAGAVHVRGDTVVAGGTFDGVMVVDGSLQLAGAWTVHGLVVVRGAVNAATGSIALTGALMSYAPASASPAADLGAGTLVWSPCTVQRAFRRLLHARPARQRSWAELF